LDQQADVTHSETLISDKKGMGTCVWVQETTYFNKSSPSDWVSCALLQLLENQGRGSETRRLNVHESFFKAPTAVLPDIIAMIHEFLFCYSCVSRSAFILWVFLN